MRTAIDIWLWFTAWQRQSQPTCVLGETNKETRKYKYGEVRSRDHFKTTQHVQRMRGISTPQTPAESDIAECSDAPLPPPLFLLTTSYLNLALSYSISLISSGCCMQEVAQGSRLTIATETLSSKSCCLLLNEPQRESRQSSAKMSLRDFGC